MQVRAILYIATLTTGIMEAVTSVDHAVAAALTARHHSHASDRNASTKSTRRLRVEAAVLLPVKEAIKELHGPNDHTCETAVLCCAMLCHAMPCAVLCCAVLCCCLSERPSGSCMAPMTPHVRQLVLLGCAVPCRAMLCRAMLCRAVP